MLWALGLACLHDLLSLSGFNGLLTPPGLLNVTSWASTAHRMTAVIRVRHSAICCSRYACYERSSHLSACYAVHFSPQLTIASTQVSGSNNMLLTLFYMVILLRNLRSVYLFKAPHHEDIWRSGGTAPRITSATEAEEGSNIRPQLSYTQKKESPVRVG